MRQTQALPISHPAEAGLAPPRLARRALLAAAPALLWTAASGVRAADIFPQRRVTLLVPFTVGTAADAVARFLAARLSVQWGVPVIVENKAGADGVVGTKAVQLAPADGHTVLFTGPPFLYNTETMDAPPYVPLQDFRPVARVSSAMWMVAASQGTAFHNLQELIAVAKKSRAEIDVAVSGSTATAVVTALGATTGIRFKPIPYISTAQAISDTAAGHVALVVASIPGIAPLVRAGRLKGLGVSGMQRSISVPEIPTLAEAGARGYGIVSWNAAFVRAGTPEGSVAVLADGLRSVASADDFKAFAREQGVEPAFMGPAAWGQEAAAERSRWIGLLSEAGLLKKS